MSRLNNFDWAEFVFDLDKLGYCDLRLIHKILSSKYLQSLQWYNQNNVEKLKEILNRHDATTNDFSNHEESDIESIESDDEIITTKEEKTDETPLFKDLTHMFGADKIWSNARIEGKLMIPYVLKMDLQTGEFLPITKEPFASRHINNNELL